MPPIIVESTSFDDSPIYVDSAPMDVEHPMDGWGEDVAPYVEGLAERDLQDAGLSPSNEQFQTPMDGQVPDAEWEANEESPDVSSIPTQGSEVLHIYGGRVSRDDDVAPKEMFAVDGISIKVKDTHEDPLTADLEVRVGDGKEKYEDVPMFVEIPVRGLSGDMHALEIIGIDDETETVDFTLD